MEKLLCALLQNTYPASLLSWRKVPNCVDSSANIKDAAWKIAFFKFANAGQTCTAPDYILCEESVHDKLVQELNKNIITFFWWKHSGLDLKTIALLLMNFILRGLKQCLKSLKTMARLLLVVATKTKRISTYHQPF